MQDPKQRQLNFLKCQRVDAQQSSEIGSLLVPRFMLPVCALTGTDIDLLSHRDLRKRGR